MTEATCTSELAVFPIVVHWVVHCLHRWLPLVLDWVSLAGCVLIPFPAQVQQLRLAALGALSALVDAAAPAGAPANSTGGISIPTPSLPGSAAAQPTVIVQHQEQGRAVGFSEVDRRDLLPSLVSGLQQLADADKSAAVVAAALGVKAALEPLLMAPAAGVVPDVMMTL